MLAMQLLIQLFSTALANTNAFSHLCVSHSFSNPAIFRHLQLTHFLFLSLCVSYVASDPVFFRLPWLTRIPFPAFVLATPPKLHPLLLQAVLLRLFTAQPGRAEGCGQGSIAQVLSGS